MKKTVIIWLLSGAFVASAGLNVHLAGRRASAGKSSAGQRAALVAQSEHLCPLTDELCLTEGQRQNICGCCGGACMRERNALQARIGGLVSELGRELNAEPVNEGRVYELAEGIAEVQAQELKSRVHSILQVRETLTRDQLDRLIATVKSP